MSDEPKKPNVPTPEQIKEAMAKAAANPGVLGQAAMMMNMAYAFQFSRMAKPQAEIVPLEQVNEQMARLHETKALIFSVSVLPPKDGVLNVLISYYRLEG
jgi:hypothetical protein